MSENGEIYTTGKKFYTAAGTDGMDKFHLWLNDQGITIQVDKLVKFQSKDVDMKIWPQ